MTTKSATWQPGATVCRCCLAEGCYKDISTEYFWMGKREVYSEMLNETFDVSIAYSQAGGPNSNSRLICEACIARLRDASEFKKQVQECEKTFTLYSEPGTSAAAAAAADVELSLAGDSKDVKLEHVKLEKRDSDDDEFGAASPDRLGDEDEEDDVDDQPLTRLATKVPKKETVDLLDFLKVSKSAAKRKSTAKGKSSPAKKTKTREAKASATKAKSPTEKKKKDKTQCDPARRNAEIIVKHTTAYPFRVNIKSILCVYCRDTYDDPKLFRDHMEEEHQTFTLNMAFVKLPKNEFIKTDLCNLRCRICSRPHSSLDDIANHLKRVHNKAIDPSNGLGIMPYRLEKDKWNCAVCSKNVPSLLHLNKHTISHFLTYVCEICGKSYIASTGLLHHVRSRHDLQYKATCRRCNKSFPSWEAKHQHQRVEKRCMAHCCTFCTDRFPTWELKQKHMVEFHGQTKSNYECSDCNINFTDRRAFYDHFKLRHSQECLVCMHCGLKFATTSRLNRHLGKHAM